MCISLVLYDSHPALLLLLAFNRDEFWDRQAPMFDGPSCACGGAGMHPESSCQPWLAAALLTATKLPPMQCAMQT